MSDKNNSEESKKEKIEKLVSDFIGISFMAMLAVLVVLIIASLHKGLEKGFEKASNNVSKISEAAELYAENIRLDYELLRQDIKIAALKEELKELDKNLEELNAVATEDCKLYEEAGILPLYCEEYLNTKEDI
jgi:cell shape-determining protein MreC